MAKALALVGDRYHEPDYIIEGLRKAFSSQDVSIRFTTDERELSAESLKDIQLLIIFREGRIWPAGYEKPEVMWMTPEKEKAITDFVRNGGGLLPLHNAPALYPKGGSYREVLGGETGDIIKGRFMYHPPVETFTVRVVDKEHPVTQGVQDYMITDEQHFLQYDAHRVRVLLRSYSDWGESVAGWVHEYDRGRVCFLANGHTLEALENTQYQRLIKNAVSWCLNLT